MTEAEAVIAHARIARDGRIVSADPRLLALQAEAGGRADGVLVIPPVASVARLSRTLGIVVSRGILVGGDRCDLDLWVRAQPDGDDVVLAVSGWQPADRRAETADHVRSRTAILDRLDQDGNWACNALLGVMSFNPALTDAALEPATPLTSLLRFEPDADDEMPILDALARQRAFSGQSAVLRDVSRARITLRGEPLRDDNGRFAGFSGQYRWISHGDAVRAKQAIGGSTASGLLPPGIDISLRAPLDRIIADADAIAQRRDGPLRQDYVGYANDIAAASRHMLGLVDDLGDVQAVEAIGFAVDAESIDLSEIVRRAASLLRVRSADRKVKIDVTDADSVFMVRGDYRRTLQILVNLIGNAVRYAPEGTSIWVRLEAEADLAVVIVADQGHGIAASDHDRIFEKFERVDPSEPGTSGLGLYISRALARAMGGDITVDSAPGQGARFALTLPIESGASALATNAPAEYSDRPQD